MSLLVQIASQARAHQSHIVLAEGDDERVARAAARACADGLARVSVIADPRRFAELTADMPGSESVEVHHPLTSDRRAAYAEAYYALRKHKGMTPEGSDAAMLGNLGYAAMMVRQGDADGTIGGAVETTAKTLRAALQIIGKAPDASIVSSFFLMILPPPHNRTVVFADCALLISPSAHELASIAVSSARSYASLVGPHPRVAMLSFSTMGSAAHESVDRVAEAVDIAKSMAPDLEIDGELQFDSAIDPGVGERKAPDSKVAGAANTFVFPDLNSGNIGYKIAQRIGGATAIGPIIQGLAKPANDLSRGCSEDDVYQMIAVTAVQAGAQSIAEQA